MNPSTIDRKNKVILIGIDGADYHLTKKWIEEGKLPNLRKISNEGIFSILKSTIPPLSPSAWTSIFTGVPPSIHGIYGFTKRQKGSYFPRIISSRDRKVEAIWNILSRYGKRSILINIPFSYPPEKINGVLITGLGTPSRESKFTYPPEFKEKILKEFPDYDVDFGEDRIDRRNPNAILPKIDKVTNAQIELTKKLFLEEKWHFFCSIFRTLDVIQHFFILDQEKILKYYELLDNLIGWILINMDLEKTLLIICSDHGFDYSHTDFNVNAWLRQMGYLKVKHNKFSIIHHVLPPVETIKKLLAKYDTGRRLAYWIKNSKVSEYILRFFSSTEIDVNRIDWSSTKAYYWDGSFGLIYINLQGREPEGTVGREERDEIIESIINDLKNLRDPKTGKSPVKKVFRGRIFYNSDDDSIPDIILQRNNGYCLRSGLMKNVFTKKEEYPGDHDVDGIFFAFKYEIQKLSLNVHDVTEILPLVLSTFGIKVKIGRSSLRYRIKKSR